MAIDTGREDTGAVKTHPQTEIADGQQHVNKDVVAGTARWIDAHLQEFRLCMNVVAVGSAVGILFALRRSLQGLRDSVIYSRTSLIRPISSDIAPPKSLTLRIDSVDRASGIIQATHAPVWRRVWHCSPLALWRARRTTSDASTTDAQDRPTYGGIPSDNPGVQVLSFGTALTPRVCAWVHDHLSAGTLVRVRPVLLASRECMEQRFGVQSDVLFGQLSARTRTGPWRYRMFRHDIGQVLLARGDTPVFFVDEHDTEDDNTRDSNRENISTLYGSNATGSSLTGSHVPQGYHVLLSSDSMIEIKTDLEAVEAAARSKPVGIWKSASPTTPSLLHRLLGWIKRKADKSSKH
eukprot:m.205852 g.205852  ORF g.205852 m.205852 type:complete len:350 (-) comp18885_c0_seq2:316-1365(-)